MGRIGRPWCLALVMVLGLPVVGEAQFAQRLSSESLYQLAQEYLKAGRTDDAIHELRKLLLVDPHHVQAQRDLAVLEQGEKAKRERIIEETLERVESARKQAREASIEEAVQWGRIQRYPSVPGETGEPKPREPLAERMHLPALPPPDLERVHRPLEKTRREVLVAPIRAGFQRLYKEGVGFEPIPGLGLSARTEIFEEPNPVDDYILESKILNFSEISQFRRSITPLFTRSAAGRLTLDYEPLPRFIYEYDAREILHEFDTRFAFKDRDLQTHAVNALYAFPEVPLLGIFTVNPWYKRVLQSSDEDLGTYEHRDQMILNFTLQPTQNIEYFFQLDMYESHKTRTLGQSKLKLFKGQVRMRFPNLRLFAIPSFEYSDTDFDPSDDEFTKRDLFVDWGFDITNRLRASTKQQVIKAETSQPGKEPSNPDAEVFNWTNTLSYELFKDFDVSLGFDLSRGFGYSNFNNVGLRAEMELFKPGIIRCKIGYEWISYYNISDDLSLVYWKFFLFQ